MPAPLASYTDIEKRQGVTYSAAERAQVAILLQDVSGLVRHRRPLIDTWIAAGRIDPTFVVGILCQVASRVIDTVGAGGLTMRSETHPEYAYELTEAATAGLWLTDEEEALLQPTPTRERRRAFSITPE